MSEENEIRVTIKPGHIWILGTSAGLMEAVEILRNLPENLLNTPGIALAINTIAAKAHEEHTNCVSKNIARIARAGHDVGRFKSISYDPNKGELICDFYEPDMFDDV